MEGAAVDSQAVLKGSRDHEPEDAPGSSYNGKPWSVISYEAEHCIFSTLIAATVTAMTFKMAMHITGSEKPHLAPSERHNLEMHRRTEQALH